MRVEQPRDVAAHEALLPLTCDASRILVWATALGDGGTLRQTRQFNPRAFRSRLTDHIGDMAMLKITGYSDKVSGRPGETLHFMVNCERPSYRADLVRLICGDDNPKGPGFKEVAVPSPIRRRYRGRRQEIAIGSYAIVESAPVLEGLRSMTVAAYVWPTT